MQAQKGIEMSPQTQNKQSYSSLPHASRGQDLTAKGLLGYPHQGQKQQGPGHT